MRRRTVAALLSGVALVSSAMVHANWPSWRGPDGNTVAPPGDYPVEFSPDNNCLWQVDLGGEGSSTPVVWGDALFLTVTDSDQDIAASYSLDGEQRWRLELGQARAGKHRSATGSNPSPVTDGEHVVVYFKSGLLACLTTTGKELWRVNLQEEYGPDTLWWDLGTSPVLTAAGVCVAVMQDGDSYLVTFDLTTGGEVWKTQRQYERPRESDQAYTTPSVVTIDGKEVIVTFGADHLTAHDAATGALLWDCGDFNPQNKGAWRVIASATVAGDIAVVPYGRANYLAAERVFANGELDHRERLWNLEGVGVDVATPVVADGKVYVVGERGKVTCLDLQTGDTLWQQNLPRGRSDYFSSPLLANGKLYCLRQDGTLYVVTADENLEVLAANEMGESAVATPVPIDGTLLVRTRTKLYRFGATPLAAR